MGKDKFVCPFCRQPVDRGKGQVLKHMTEAHSKEFDIYPNALVPKEVMYEDYTQQ